MHLLIAREANDEHLQIAGERRTTSTSRTRPRPALKAGGFYAKWFLR